MTERNATPAPGHVCHRRLFSAFVWSVDVTGCCRTWACRWQHNSPRRCLSTAAVYILDRVAASNSKPPVFPTVYCLNMLQIAKTWSQKSDRMHIPCLHCSVVPNSPCRWFCRIFMIQTNRSWSLSRDLPCPSNNSSRFVVATELFGLWSWKA